MTVFTPCRFFWRDVLPPRFCSPPPCRCFRCVAFQPVGPFSSRNCPVPKTKNENWWKLAVIDLDFGFCHDFLVLISGLWPFFPPLLAEPTFCAIQSCWAAPVSARRSSCWAAPVAVRCPWPLGSSSLPCVARRSSASLWPLRKPGHDGWVVAIKTWPLGHVD